MAESLPPYASTTAPLAAKQKKIGYLTTLEVFLKGAEVVLSFIAFVLEEVVTDCNVCGKLYFFEFVSCTALLFTLLLSILLGSKLHTKVGINSWDTLDFGYTILIFILFPIASLVFMLDNTGTLIEQVAAVFGIFATVAFFINVGVIVRFRRKEIWCFNLRGMTRQPSSEHQQPQSPETERLDNGLNA